jgi:hypothetical protein
MGVRSRELSPRPTSPPTVISTNRATQLSSRPTGLHNCHLDQPGYTIVISTDRATQLSSRPTGLHNCHLDRPGYTIVISTDQREWRDLHGAGAGRPRVSPTAAQAHASGRDDNLCVAIPYSLALISYFLFPASYFLLPISYFLFPTSYFLLFPPCLYPAVPGKSPRPAPAYRSLRPACRPGSAASGGSAARTRLHGVRCASRC